MRGHARRAGKRVTEALQDFLLGGPARPRAQRNGSRPWSSGSAPSEPPPRTKNSYSVSYASLALAGVTGAGLYYYFEKVKADRHARAALKGAQNAKVAGKADIGGPFTLIDSATNKSFSSDQLKGTWSLLYFGFTHCPDICPDELEKIAAAVDMVDIDVGFMYYHEGRGPEAINGGARARYVFQLFDEDGKPNGKPNTELLCALAQRMVDKKEAVISVGRTSYGRCVYTGGCGS